MVADPVEILGEIAANCDIYAANPHLNRSEKNRLELRAAKYRLQQMIEADRATFTQEGERE